MAKDKQRYSKDQRYEIILDNGEDPTSWSDLLGNVTTIASGSEHITGTRSVSFNKAAGTSADGYIVKRISGGGTNLDSFSAEGQILSSVYFSSIADISTFNIALLMSSGTDNGAVYTVPDTDLAIGWNHIAFDCNNYSTQLGAGIDWRGVKYVAAGVTFDAAGDALSSILVDSVRLQIPTAVFNFDPNIDNVTMQTEVQIKHGNDADELSVDAANTARSTSTNVIPVQVIDDEGKVQKSGADSDSPVYVQDVGGGSGGGGGNMLYISPEDFSAAYSTASGIILTGLSWTPSLEQFVGVTQFNNVGLAASLTPSTNDFDYDSSTGTLNLGGTPAFAATDQGYRVQVYGPDKAYNKASDANKQIVLNPINDVYQGETLAAVTDGADDTYYYYASMDGYNNFACQMILNGGSGSVIVTLEGTVQDDGTAAASCTYVDVTSRLVGVANIIAGAGVTVNDIWLGDTKLNFKYLRYKVVADTSASDDADWTLYHRKSYV